MTTCHGLVRKVFLWGIRVNFSIISITLASNEKALEPPPAVMVLPLIVARWKLVGILGSLSYVTNSKIGAIG